MLCSCYLIETSICDFCPELYIRAVLIEIDIELFSSKKLARLGMYQQYIRPQPQGGSVMCTYTLGGAKRVNKKFVD